MAGILDVKASVVSTLENGEKGACATTATDRSKITSRPMETEQEIENNTTGLFDHPLVPPKKGTSSFTSGKRNIANRKPLTYVQKELQSAITDEDGTGIRPELVDYGEEPHEKCPAGRTPNYIKAIGAYLDARICSDASSPAQRNFENSFSGISDRLKAMVGLAKNRREMGLQLPPESFAYSAASDMSMRDLCTVVHKMAKRVCSSKQTSQAEKQEVGTLVTAVLSLHHDNTRKQRAMTSALVGASRQIREQKYNMALVYNENGVPHRMPKPPEGMRPLTYSMYSNNTVVIPKKMPRPHGISGHGPRLKGLLLGRTDEQTSASRKSTLVAAPTLANTE